MIEAMHDGNLGPLPQRRSATALRRAGAGDGTRTVVIAFLANVVIAVAKLIVGLASRSTSMLAEAAHSMADSINEVFLAVGLYRQGAPADATHPSGHGRERFLWSFIAVISSFLIGGCVSIALALTKVKEQQTVSNSLAAWIVLGISFVAEGVSWLQSMRQARTQAKEYEISMWTYMRYSSDPLVRAIVVEDSAALIGLCLAAGGLFFSTIFATNAPDTLASLLIGILLAITAFALARSLADFLVGRSLPAPQLERLHTIIKEEPAVEEVLALRATYSGPEEVIVLGKIRPSPDLSIQQLTRAMDDLDHKIRDALPLVADVFIDVSR